MQADVQHGWRDPDPEVFPLSVPGWNFSDKIFAHIMITIGVAASPHLLQVQLPGTLLPGPQPLPQVQFLSLTESYTLFPREYILSLSFSQSEGLSLLPRVSPTSSRSSPSPGHQGKADENSNTDQVGGP